MKTYPIHVKRDSYHGTNAKRRAKALAHNHAATRLETYVNELLLKQTEPIQVYTWGAIAGGCGLRSSLVAELGFSIDAGSNGFTAWRHDLTYEQAIEANREPNN